MNTPSRVDSLWMIGASVAFAGMAASVKLAAQHGVPLAQILFYRGLLSLVVMWTWMRATRVPFGTRHWRAHLQRGVAGYIGMIAYFGGITLLPLAAAVTLNYTSPLLLAILLLALHGERPPRSMVLAMAGGFTGIVLLLRPSYAGSQWLGVALALGSAVTAAIAALNIRSLGRLDEPISRTAAWFSLYTTLGSLPWFLWTRPGMLSPAAIASVVAIGLLATVGQVMLTLAYQRGVTLLTSLLGYSQVIFTSLIGIAVWADHPGIGSWLAMVLIIASGAAATTFMRAAPSDRSLAT